MPLVFVIGKILRDLLPDGWKIGNAPANFAFNSRSLRAASAFISPLGDNDSGLVILARKRYFPGLKTPQQVAFLKTYLLNLIALTPGPLVKRLFRPSFGIMKPGHPSDAADIIGA